MWLLLGHKRVYPNEIEEENCLRVKSLLVNQANGSKTVDGCTLETCV